MEPLREWFCKGADVISLAECEAALCQLEQDTPEILLHNDNIREERWAHFSLEGDRFPTVTVDVTQREKRWPSLRDLIIHFQRDKQSSTNIS